MKTIWIPQTIASVMLLGALNPSNPYGYYIILRWICCGVFVYLLCESSERKKRQKRQKQSLFWVFGIMAVIYNPIFRVHLNRELWSIINVVTIGIALVSIFILKEE